tara:strand:+ start:11719 stop:12606 length:888 start_codon:yes stop_codon:yes gene_type:complete
MTKYKKGSIVSNNEGHQVIVLWAKNKEVMVETRRGHSLILDRGNVDTKRFKVRDEPSVCGIGYLGYGEYVTKVRGKRTQSYEAWRGIIRRCYDPKSQKYGQYGGVGIQVSEDWKDFQKFSEWYYKNKVSNEVKYHVDKDILGHGLYSPQSSLLVPHYINIAFTTGTSKDPIGYMRSREHRFSISVLGKSHQLPNYDGGNPRAYYNYFKDWYIVSLTHMAHELGHIGIDTLRSIVDTIRSRHIKIVTDKSSRARDVLIEKVIDATGVKLAIDNGIPVRNLYHKGHLDNIIKYLEDK